MPTRRKDIEVEEYTPPSPGPSVFFVGTIIFLVSITLGIFIGIRIGRNKTHFLGYRTNQPNDMNRMWSGFHRHRMYGGMMRKGMWRSPMMNRFGPPANGNNINGNSLSPSITPSVTPVVQ